MRVGVLVWGSGLGAGLGASVGVGASVGASVGAGAAAGNSGGVAVALNTSYLPQEQKAVSK